MATETTKWKKGRRDERGGKCAIRGLTYVAPDGQRVKVRQRWIRRPAEDRGRAEVAATATAKKKKRRQKRERERKKKGQRRMKRKKMKRRKNKNEKTWRMRGSRRGVRASETRKERGRKREIVTRGAEKEDDVLPRLDCAEEARTAGLHLHNRYIPAAWTGAEFERVLGTLYRSGSSSRDVGVSAGSLTLPLSLSFPRGIGGRKGTDGITERKRTREIDR